MQFTTNLNLSKPDYDNVCDVTVLDDNFDKLDQQFAGNKWVKTVNGVAPVNHNVQINLGVTSVNGMTGAVTITERTVPQIINIVYPVGSYYDTSDVGFDPNVTWGGRWEHVVDGCVLIAGGGTYQVGKVYGETTHKLTINELPAHSHSATATNSGNHTHTSEANGVHNHSVAENGNHSHTRGTMNITGEFGADDRMLYELSGAFSQGAYADTGSSGTGAGNKITFDASKTWTGQTSVAGSHTHTLGNSGSHNHTINASGTHTHTITVGNTGGNVAFNVMQQSLAVSRWHRIG